MVGTRHSMPVTNVQLYLAIGVPMLFNAVLTGLLLTYINSKFDGVKLEFQNVNQRFDDMRDLLRAELRRVEEVLDARLRHLEERWVLKIAYFAGSGSLSTTNPWNSTATVASSKCPPRVVPSFNATTT
jgi:hypothetical protein